MRTLISPRFCFLSHKSVTAKFVFPGDEEGRTLGVLMMSLGRKNGLM